MKLIHTSDVFLNTKLAHEYANQAYPDKTKYAYDFRMMKGGGTRAVVWEYEEDDKDEVGDHD